MKIKETLHERNRHRSGYDLDTLISVVPGLKSHVKTTPSGEQSINWSSPQAVLLLNKALILKYYKIENWSIPKGFLCPPVPGRADYIHYLADLLASVNNDKIPKGRSVRVLDLGVGANCIFPIVGVAEYGWRFVGAETNPTALKSAKGIAAFNTNLSRNVEIRMQKQADSYLHNIIRPNDFFDALVCNPPFYKDTEEANNHALRKLNNLNKRKGSKKVLNFGGENHELVTENGELGFLKGLIEESAQYPTRVFWYTSLVSNGKNLSQLYKHLKDNGVFEYKTIEMKQGNKTSRILAWTYLKAKEQKKWNFGA
jgi:23S rRNA (adenine1618-N6)-methyltransferase